MLTRVNTRAIFKWLLSWPLMFKMCFGSCLILVPKLQPGLPEARFGLGTPEKNAKAEPRVDGGCRSRSSSSMPTSPKPPLQSPKPSPAARPSIPQKPRTASRPGKGISSLGVRLDMVWLHPPMACKSRWNVVDTLEGLEAGGGNG